MFNPKLSFTQSYVSELGVTGQPNVWLVRVGNFIGAFLLFIAFYFYFLNSKNNKLPKEKVHLIKILCIATGAALANAFFPMDCSASESRACFQQQQRYSFGISQWVHLFTSIIMFGGLIYTQYYVTYKIIKPTGNMLWVEIGRASIYLQILLNISVAIVSFTGYGPIGLLQRLSLFLFEACFIIILFNNKLNILDD